MARRKLDESLEKVSLNLIKGDREELQNYFKKKGYGYAIRRLVHSYLEYLHKKSGPPPDDFEFNAEDLESIMRETLGAKGE